MGRIAGLKVCLVGDILHSRVARSAIHGLRTLGAAEIRVAAPPTLIPAGISDLGAQVFHDLDAALDSVDVVMLLRLQKERMLGAFLPSLGEFHRDYGLTHQRAARLPITPSSCTPDRSTAASKLKVTWLTGRAR